MGQARSEARAVMEAIAAGAQLIVAPNTDGDVIAVACEHDAEVLPGVFTPTDVFAALGAGARHLKLFPASSIGPTHLRSIKEVLPPACSLWAVGGTSVSNLAQWLNAGALGVGVGTALYRPGYSLAEIAVRAARLVSASQVPRAP